MKKAKFKRYGGTSWEEYAFLPITVDNVTVDTDTAHGLKVTSNNQNGGWSEGVYVCTATDKASVITCGSEDKKNLITMCDYHMADGDRMYLETRFAGGSIFRGLSFYPDSTGSNWQVSLGGGTAHLDAAYWASGSTVIGADGHDKVVIGYSDKAIIGGVTTACNWAPLTVQGTKINLNVNGTNYATLTADNLTFNDTAIEIFPTSKTAYDQGVRIHHSSSGWAGIFLCGDDNTASSGTSAHTWAFLNNVGKLSIAKNSDGINSGSVRLTCLADNVWRVNGNQIIDASNIGSQSVASATKATQDASGNVITDTYATKKYALDEAKTWGKYYGVEGHAKKYIDQLNASYPSTGTPPSGIPYMSWSGGTVSALDGSTVYSYVTSMLAISSTKQTVSANSASSAASRTYAIQQDSSGNLVVNVPWTDTTYALPAASTSTRGGVMTTAGHSGDTSVYESYYDIKVESSNYHVFIRAGRFKQTSGSATSSTFFTFKKAMSTFGDSATKVSVILGDSSGQSTNGGYMGSLAVDSASSTGFNYRASNGEKGYVFYLAIGTY